MRKTNPPPAVAVFPMQTGNNTSPQGDRWPEPRVRSLEVEELYRSAGPAAAFSYFGALLTLGVLLETGDVERGSLWFAWASAVTVLRFAIVMAYRQRRERSDPEPWARLVIAANVMAGIQWGLLGTLLFAGPAYRQLFTMMVIICFVAGSVTAYASVRGAHEALTIPAAIPTAIYVFFIHDGVHLMAGAASLFFCFAILYYAHRQNSHIARGYHLQVERDDLLGLTSVLNEKLQKENRELAHRAAMRGASVSDARDRAGRLEAFFRYSPLPQLECDGVGHIVHCNPAAERVFGMRHGEVVGWPLASFLVGDAFALAGPHEARSIPVEVRTRDGERRGFTAYIVPLPAPEGMKPGFAVTLSAATEASELK